MKRREVLGLGALGLSAATLDGCAFFPWPEHAAMSERDLEKILAQLDARLEKIRGAKSTLTIPGIGKIDASADQDGRDAIAKIISALHVIGTYREVPEPSRALEHVEKHFNENMPEAFETITGSRDWIKKTSEENFAKLDRRFKRDPDMPMKIMERVDEIARTFEIPIEQRTYLRTATTQLTWRFRAQGTRAVIDDVVEKYDRAIARQAGVLGMPQEDAPHAVTQDAQNASGGDAIRIRFFTNASEAQMHRATCLLRPTILVEDRERPVDLQWRDGAGHIVGCTGSPAPNAIRAIVEMTPDPQNPRSIVIVTLEPPPNATPDLIDELRPYVRDIATELRRRTSVASATIAVTPATESDAPKANSARLIETTRKTAKWGAILLIPPICFVGILILLVCLFMVIVAGFMAAGGD